MYIPYLTLQDYLPYIQKGQLNSQLLDSINGDMERTAMEQTAIETIYENLSQEYDLDLEITDTLPYDPTKIYGANNRVTIDYDDWVSGTTYEVDVCVINNRNGYQCILENHDATFNPENWIGLGKQYEIYYVRQPYPTFSLQLRQQKGPFTPGLYKIGDNVFWDKNTYTALRDTPNLSQQDIQFVTYANQPPANIFPNDPNHGHIYWTNNGEYLIDVNTPTSNSIWIKGDNRDKKMMMAIIDITLFYLHKRISPNNVPDIRYRAYDEAKKWMETTKLGTTKPALIAYQPEQGRRIIGGSDVKTVNSW